MTTRTTEPTAAEILATSPAIEDAMATILRELTETQASIAGPRPPNSDLKIRYDKYLQRAGQLRGRPPVYPYVGSGIGRGPLVELADGSVKWDMINGIGVHAFGHSDPDLIETALRAALGDTVQQGNLQFNADAIEFSDLILSEAARESALSHCFLTNSGCMANEAALKVCYQKHAPAARVIAFNDGFAGRSVTMSQIGDNAAGRVGVPLTISVDYVPFFDSYDGERSIVASADRLKELIARYPGQHACFVMELIQGEGGFNSAPREFFVTLMELCRENNIGVWIDEVQTFGRTESMFHFQQLDLGQFIDVVTFGKMTQVCGCLYTEAMNPAPGLLSGTFIGGTVELQVGRRIVQRLRDDAYYGADGRIPKLQRAFRAHAARLVESHREWFPAIADRHGQLHAGGFFDGVGGMMRITPFAGRKDAITSALRTMFDEGLIAFYCGHGPYHIRFLPPVGVMEPKQFDDVFAILERSLAQTAVMMDGSS